MKTKKLLTALALFGSLGVVNNSWGETVQEICQTTTETLPGAFANLMLVLDYSGSMDDYLYKNEVSYNPNELYFGYFDPFGAYVYDSNAGAYIKISNIDPDPVNHDQGKQFQYGGKNYGVQARYRYRNEALDTNVVYSGNYLNWYYMTKVDLLRLILTGGKTTFSGNSYVEYTFTLPQPAITYTCPQYQNDLVKDIILFGKSLTQLVQQAANVDSLNPDDINQNVASCLYKLASEAQNVNTTQLQTEIQNIWNNSADFDSFVESEGLSPQDFNNFLNNKNTDYKSAIYNLLNDLFNNVVLSTINSETFKNIDIKNYIQQLIDYAKNGLYSIANGLGSSIDANNIENNFLTNINNYTNTVRDKISNTYNYASADIEKLIQLCEKLPNCQYDATQNAIIYKAYAPQSLLQFYCPMLDTFNADWAKRHFFCRFLPHGYLRKACHNGEVQISCQTETGTLFVELQDGTKIYANSTITYNPANGQVEGLLQRLEEVSYKPRVGAALYSNPSDDEVIKDWIYPGYSYSGVIDVINNENPEGGTPTGEAFDEIKRYFSRESGVWGGFSTNDAGYVDPYTFTINVDNYTIEDSKNLNILISDGAWNGHGGVYNYPPSNCLNDSIAMKNLPDVSVSWSNYWICAIDPAQPVYNMWKGSKADLVPELAGNQNVETISVPVLMDSSQSYGLNAMKNIAIAGGFIDKDNDQLPAGYTSEPPNPQCGADQGPPCGSFVDIPSADSDPNNEWHTNSGDIVNYYSASQPYDLLSALVKSFENAVGKIKNVTCYQLLTEKEIPSAFIANYVRNTLQEINTYVNSDNLDYYKKAAEALLNLVHYDLYLANYPYLAKIEFLINQINSASDVTSFQNAVNNAISTVFLSYRQALMNTLNALIQTLEEQIQNSSGEVTEEILNTERKIVRTVRNLAVLYNQNPTEVTQTLENNINNPQQFLTETKNAAASYSVQILLWLEY
jgi:nitrogen regulatory protein PII-like uncharacterized protein